MTPEEKADLFKGKSVEDRVEAMAAAGRVVWGEQVYVIAQMKAAIRDAVAAERERCARIADVKVERPDDETAAEAAREIAARIRRGEQ